MANFRGYGDDALKAKESIRSNETKRFGIKTSAATAAAANATARAGLRQREEQANASRAERARQADMQNENAKIRQQETAQKNQADLDIKLAEESRKQKQFKINEDTYARMQAEYQSQQELEELWKSEETATKLGIFRHVATSDSQVPPYMLNKLNAAKGIATGDPGSYTGTFPIIDPKTGARYGTGMTSIGKDGEEIQTVLDPNVMFSELRAGMPPDEWIKFSNQIQANDRSGGVDSFSAAAIRQNKQLQSETAKLQAVSKLMAERTKLSDQNQELSELAKDKTETHIFAPDEVIPGNADAKKQLGLNKAVIEGIDKQVQTALGDGGVAEQASVEIDPRQKELFGEATTDKGDNAGVSTAQSGASKKAPERGMAQTKDGRTIEVEKAEDGKWYPVKGQSQSKESASVKEQSKKVVESDKKTVPVQESKSEDSSKKESALAAEKERRLNNAKKDVETSEQEEQTISKDGGNKKQANLGVSLEQGASITKEQYEKAKRDLKKNRGNLAADKIKRKYEKDNKLDFAGRRKRLRERVAKERKSKLTPEMSERDYDLLSEALDYKKNNPKGTKYDRPMADLSNKYGYDYHDWQDVKATVKGGKKTKMSNLSSLSDAELLEEYKRRKIGKK